MKPEIGNIFKLLNGNFQFIIPVYQRKYNWKYDVQCHRLWQDIVEMETKKKRYHFVGSIVNITETVSTMGIMKFIIIDGQQRVTTMSLLMAALRDFLISNGTSKQITDNVNTQTLKNAGYTDDCQYKLLLTEEDRTVYNKIVDGNGSARLTDEEKTSNIYINYDYFLQKIKSGELTLDQIYESIGKLEIVNIILDRADGDDPQRIFESLNSTGMQLEKSDLIRNYMLMGIAEEMQRDIYCNYWQPFEASFKGRNSEERRQLMDDFFRFYLAVKTGRVPSMDMIYEAFKNYADPLGSEGIPTLANDIYKFGRYFNNIINAATGLKKLDKKLRELSTLQTNIPSLFFMPYLEYADTHDVSDEERAQVFDIVENYLARRIMCNAPSASLTKVFTTLHNEVIKIYERAKTRGVELTNSYADIMTYVLLRKAGHSYFPTDIDVRNDFPTRKVYKFTNPNKWFLLERMENLNGKEVNDVVASFRDGSYTIEHIMPQTLSEKWKAALGLEWERIHSEYLHTFANLTITGYNSNYGNRPFLQKRDGYTDKDDNEVTGYKESVFHLSQGLGTFNQWTEKEIIDRGKWMADRFLTLWPMPKSTYVPPLKENEEMSFDEIIDGVPMTNRELVGFIFDGQTYPETIWKDMLVKLSALVYQQKKYEVRQLCATEEWYHVKKSLHRCSKFAEDCYVWTHSNTNNKMQTIKVLFDTCRIDYARLTILLAPTEPGQS